ncbi:related to REX4-strong similarity to X.laevis XPMC2 protein [Serendipita indica DSM 11827]|uniref:RNA exonuclease 4 n=1 Tax=Serendipita indica (strain DSM 11827) TaxID=1109443 RepID=G4TAI5_SERID|nr:related to REX4-strong similarity to X.laevis XPMC2 protein [Serendipita indica DSM 11827]
MTSTTTPSANWLALKRSLPSNSKDGPAPKRRKTAGSTSLSRAGQLAYASSNKNLHSMSTSVQPETHSHSKPTIVGDPDSKENLVAMILRPSSGKERAKPTKFIAMDCEMVGVGPFGVESALARVTVVNYVGDVVLDEFVLPQEAVTDWRTAVSGVRKEDMVNAKSFGEVQAMVSELLNDRYLVGHALHNDLSALLLSHPWTKTRDTQNFKVFKTLSKSSRPALRKLVKAVFDINIQEGEHSSIIDARAPMALYRMYRKQWESPGTLKEPIKVTVDPPMSLGSVVNQPVSSTVEVRSFPTPDEDGQPEEGDSDISINITKKPKAPDLHKASTPKGALSTAGPAKKKKKQGISSGISVVVTRNERTQIQGRTRNASSNARGGKQSSGGGGAWWKTLKGD